MEEPAPVPVQIIVFPGTTRERDDLFAAVARNCACRSGSAGTPDSCPPHELLVLEPTLKRLVFYRRFSRSLTRAEWLEEPGWSSGDP
jgi:hypothetical protein